MGVNLAFTAPEKVGKGETFHLDIFIVNRSVRRKRLGIVAIPQPRGKGATAPLGSDRAQAVLDDAAVYALQSFQRENVAEIVILNADVRVGYGCLDGECCGY